MESMLMMKIEQKSYTFRNDSEEQADLEDSYLKSVSYSTRWGFWEWKVQYIINGLIILPTSLA